VSRPGGRPSAEASFRRPSGANADGVPTVRNIIPWKDMEKKVAEKLAAKAAAGELDELDGGSPETDSLDRSVSSKGPPPWKTDVEPAPDSGVRSSVNSPIGPLTYSAYTVAELEARGEARPPRMSMAFAPALPPSRSRWADAAQSGVVVVRAWWACVRSPKPRPRVLDVCRVPLQAFKTDLATALKALPWKKLGIGVGIAFGSLLLLLFIVLTAAELTDDLKPARTSSASTENGTSLPAPSATTQTNAPAPAEPEPAPAIELDDDVPAAATAPKAKPRPAPPATKKPMMKKKGVELFSP
jgi:hypothetical protein